MPRADPMLRAVMALRNAASLAGFKYSMSQKSQPDQPSFFVVPVRSTFVKPPQDP